MPLYEYYCPECDDKFNRYLPLDQYNVPQRCEHDHPAIKQYSPPYIINRFESYESPITGEPITSEKRRREDLASSGCVEYEPGMRQDADARVAEGERKLEKAVDETVDRLIHEMPSHKRENLERELGHGADVVYERRGSD